MNGILRGYLTNPRVRGRPISIRARSLLVAQRHRGNAVIVF